LIGKSQFGLVIESGILIVLFFVEIFLELMIIEFLLLVPIAKLGLCIKSIQDCVVMHMIIIGNTSKGCEVI